LVFTHVLSDALILHAASDYVTNQVTHRILNTDLSYSCAHFVVEIDENSSLNGGF